MKPIVAIVAAALLFVPGPVHAADGPSWPSSRLNALDILLNFPICSLRSSVSPICPDCGAEADAFSFRTILELSDGELTLDKSSFMIETQDWYYIVDVRMITPERVVMRFIDDGKIGNIHSVEDFALLYRNETEDWRIDSRRVVYYFPPDPSLPQDGAFHPFDARCLDALTFRAD